MSKATTYSDLLSATPFAALETYVDADACGGLPKRLRGFTRLDIGLNMAVPVNPLEITDAGIRAGLSFDGRVSVVLIPWDAVVCVRDCAGNEHMRNMVLAQALIAARSEAPKPRPSARKAVACTDGSNVVHVDFTARRAVR